MRSLDTEDRLRRPARIRSLRVGDLRVSYVPDGAVRMVPRGLFPATSDETWVRNAPYLDPSGWLTISAGGLLIEHGERAMLVDAGYGPFAEPVSMMEHGMASMYGGSLLESLAALGRTPREIEAVAITHLHIEHVGWAAHPGPDSTRPAFGQAAYLVSRGEWEDRHTTFGVTEEIADALAPAGAFRRGRGRGVPRGACCRAARPHGRANGVRGDVRCRPSARVRRRPALPGAGGTPGLGDRG